LRQQYVFPRVSLLKRFFPIKSSILSVLIHTICTTYLHIEEWQIHNDSSLYPLLYLFTLYTRHSTPFPPRIYVDAFCTIYKYYSNYVGYKKCDVVNKQDDGEWQDLSIILLRSFGPTRPLSFITQHLALQEVWGACICNCPTIVNI
jgi:hypothetical protein